METETKTAPVAAVPAKKAVTAAAISVTNWKTIKKDGYPKVNGKVKLLLYDKKKGVCVGYMSTAAADINAHHIQRKKGDKIFYTTDNETLNDVAAYYLISHIELK